jgi:recombinational DNA repair ATPase RecF
MNTTERAIEIIKSCKNEQQTEVATRFVELLLKSRNPLLTKDQRVQLLNAIDNKLTDLKHELLTTRQTAFV